MCHVCQRLIQDDAWAVRLEKVNSNAQAVSKYHKSSVDKVVVPLSTKVMQVLRQRVYRQAGTSVAGAVNCQDRQLELCLTVLQRAEPFQYLIASSGTHWPYEVELVIHIVLHLQHMVLVATVDLSSKAVYHCLLLAKILASAMLH